MNIKVLHENEYKTFKWDALSKYILLREPHCVGGLQNFSYTCCTGKSLSESLLFAEHGENMLCTKVVLNARNNFCTQHVLPRFELGIFMY